MVYGSVFGSVTEGTIDPKYAAPNGAFDAVTEAIELDQAMFNAFVERDFNEVMSQYNPVMAESYDVLNEGFLGDVWQKILTILKKIKDKVVSIAKAAAIRIGAFFTRDNAELVRKYMKQFDAAVKKGVDLEIKDYADPEEAMKNSEDAGDGMEKGGLSAAFEDVCKLKTKDEVDRYMEDIEEKLCKSLVLSDVTSIKDIKKAICDIDSVTKTQKVNPNAVKNFLVESKTFIMGIESIKNDALMELKKDENKAAEMKKDAKKGDSDDELAVANAAQKVVTLTQKITTTALSATIDLVKKLIKIQRKAFITIAVRGTKNGEKASKEVDEKKTKDDTAELDESYLLQAELDNQDYVVESAFEEYIPDEDLVA